MLNKTDRVTEAGLRAVREAMDAAGGSAAVICSAYGRIDPEVLLDPVTRADEDDSFRQLTFEDLLPEADRTHADHLHAAYDSVSFTADVPLSPRLFMAFLDSRPAGLYRIKGFVDFGAGDPGNRYTLHAVGRFLRFVPQRWARDEPRRTQLVLIGAGVDAASLRKELEGCRDEWQDATEELERSMWGVLRYVRQPGDDEA